MITFKTGDIFQEKTEAIVNTVNCVGVMGRGIALQFKKLYPENFKAYEKACKNDEMQTGKMFIHDLGFFSMHRFIINFPTKRHWRGRSRMEDIESGLIDLVQQIKLRSIKSIAIPPLGCGLGGLNWSEVRERIENALSALPQVNCIVYEPEGSPETAPLFASSKPLKMTPGRAALVVLMQRYQEALLVPFITLLEIQKLMYFLQEKGEPLRLQFKKHFYGPYADNLRHVLRDVEGLLLSGYADGGDAPEKVLELLPSAYTSAISFIEKHLETNQHLQAVSELVNGFESPSGMELLSTVHWVVTREQPTSYEDLIDKVHTWNTRKRQMFNQREIKLAYQTLCDKGWFSSHQAIH